MKVTHILEDNAIKKWSISSTVLKLYIKENFVWEDGKIRYILQLLNKNIYGIKIVYKGEKSQSFIYEIRFKAIFTATFQNDVMIEILV